MSENIYVVLFPDRLAISTHRTLQEAKDQEIRLATMLHYNCLGRWKYMKNQNRWKTRWEDTKSGNEYLSFIFETSIV